MKIDTVVMVKPKYTKLLSDIADEMHSTQYGIERTGDYLVDKFSYSKGLPIVGIVVKYGAIENGHTFLGVEYTNGVNKGFQFFDRKNLIKLS